jgi:hypothetical protein
MKRKRGEEGFLVLGTAIFLLSIFLQMHMVSAYTIVHNSEASFDAGTYNDTFYNASGSHVRLSSSISFGSYTSSVLSGGASCSWRNITWVAGTRYGLPLPDSQRIEIGGMDMTNNVLLYYLNESSGNLVDSSGNSNTGRAQGSATYRDAGKLDSAVTLDGNTDFFNVTNSASINVTGSFTVS